MLPSSRKKWAACAWERLSKKRDQVAGYDLGVAMQLAHKVVERVLVERFRRCWAGGASIRSLHRYESPDFYGLFSAGRVGIELVRLIDEQAAEGGPLVKRYLAQELEEAANTARIAVIFDVDFDKDGALNLTSRKARGSLISSLVALARDPGTHDRFLGREELKERKVAGVHGVRLMPSRPEWGSGVMIGRMGAGDRDRSLVPRCIAKKEANVPVYRARIAPGAELWLLIVAGLSFDSFVDVYPEDGPFATRFDRVFVLDHDPECVFELRGGIRRPDPRPPDS